jgi:autotransporter-associated beta strand protein
MKKLPHAIVSAALLWTGVSFAQNIWDGAGVNANTGTDWTLSANYTATPTFNSTTDLKFSTITGTGSGLTLTAGTAGTYDVKSLIFGESSIGQPAAEHLVLNGTGTPGATTIHLSGNIDLPNNDGTTVSNGSVVVLGSDLTLNLSNGAHTVSRFGTSNTTGATLAIKALVTGGGASASFNNNNANARIIYSNNNNAFVLSGAVRYNGYVGFTSVANVGAGNSALGNATDATTGLLYMSNGSVLDYIGVGDQSTDRAMKLDGTVSFNNSSANTTLTYNGSINPNGGAGSEVRSAVIGGSTVVFNSVIGGIYGVRTQSSTSYDADGVAFANNGLGTLILNGNNTFTGNVTVGVGTLQLGHVNALGTTAGTTFVTGGTLDLNGFTISETITRLSGTGVLSSGAIINTNLSSRAGISGGMTLFGNASVGGAGDIAFSGAMDESGARSLTKVGAGTVTLSGVNTYTGGTTISAGTLTFANTSAKASGTVTAAAGATVGLGVGGAGFYGSSDVDNLFANTLSGFSLNATTGVGIDTTAGNFTYATSQAGTRSLTKLGANTFTLSGTNSYTGGTRVKEGTLAFANSFAMSGANQMKIAAAGVAGVNYATVSSTVGTLTFGGTLGIDFTTSLSGGESFHLFTANGGALAGNFSSVSLTGTYIASLTDNGSGTWTGSVGDLNFTFATSGINAGILSVVNSAVPEPSTYAAIFGALALGTAVIRRRRSE